jgi:ATP-dependent Lon protease
VLEQERPKIRLLDELDKFSKSWQNKLLSLLEGGWVKVNQMKREYDFTIKGAKVFASANYLNKLSAPLRSRFRCLHLPKYSGEQFLQIAVKVCPKVSEETAMIIAEETWEQHGDIRDVISLSKLVKKHDGPGEIAEIIKTLTKYGDS